MAGHYRSKRRVVGPSKNEEKVQRAREAEAMGRSSNQLGSRYPSVKSIAVKLAFVGAQQQSLGEETRTYNPPDACNFSVACPGICGVGSFDLATKIASVVAAGDALAETSGICQQKVYAGKTDTCQCTLRCRIEVSYRPVQPAAAPPPPIQPA